MKKALLMLLMAVVSCVVSSAQTTINIDNSYFQPGQTYNWTKNNVYLLDGLVFVDSTAVLNIEAGTVVKFTPRADVGNPSSLIVARGGKIFAEGTADEPIIFTAEADDVNNPTDLGPNDVSQWGGIALLGRGLTEKGGVSVDINVEGIPTSNPQGLYGGNDNTDNSGVLRYVSIRHGGRQISSTNELNGLTLAAVGSGTTLEYIEIYANSDDGIEFFGGAPNLKYAVVAFAEDDSYDWDEVYTGKGQFWFSIQRSDVADAAGELDGSSPDDDTPYSNPTIYNWTHIGSGVGAAAVNPIGWQFRAGTAGTVANSILVDTKGKAIEVQDKAAGINDAYAKLATGELKILNNLFFKNGSFTTLDGSATGIIRVSSGTPEDSDASDLAANLAANNNKVADPGILSISRIQDNNLDPRPTGNADVLSGLAAFPTNDPFFTQVNYKGAFPPFAAGMWLRGWTALDRNNHLKNLQDPQTVFVNDNSIKPCETVTWTKDKTYIVDGITFVDSCATLNIEAGTVVKFTPRADVGNPSSLVVARGGKIFAEGTAAEPIIFTAEADDVNNPTDLGPNDVSQWGGIALLGFGVTEKSGVTTNINVEGIPTSEKRGFYGGTNNADNSGVLRYVSIRHGGRQISSTNELNGLTLAAVGSGTTLEYIEIYANADDGIEFFGGAPNLKYAVVAFAEDDSYDWDEVYTGKGQFWFSIQRSDVADAAGELDGSSPDDDTPYSNPTIYNWTHIGSGVGAAATNPIGWQFRAGTAGTVANSILVDTKGKAIEVQDKAAGINDSYAKLATGELKILNNLFFKNGSFTTLDGSATGIIRVSSGTPEDSDASDLAANLAANNNKVADPGILSISRIQDNNLDPRPTGNADVLSGLAAFPTNDPFFTQVNYKGAFPPFAAGMWLRGWTALDRNNHLKNLQDPQTVFVNDNSIQPCETVTWTKDKTYIVDGITFVDSCATLNIEAGTVVKFTPRADVGNPSSLVVARGGKIFANGTAAEPIIFTAEADDVNNPTDLGPNDVSQWGGIALLGFGVTEKSGVTTNINVEGIPTSEKRGFYGGTNNADNSGVLRYVSIRHGGRQISSTNELNGLTLAAVGSGTTLEYIEIYANSDDGIEFFGGAPNLKYAIVAFAEDDSYDWDEVYTGKGQFWFSIQRSDVADAAGELDGSSPDDDTPYSNPTIYNWTHIGSGVGAAATNPIGWQFRAGTAGTVANSVMVEMKGKYIEVQDKAAGINDSYAKLATGELKILNNVFYRAGSTVTLDGTATGVIRVTSSSNNPEDTDASDLADHLSANSTSLFSPYIRQISRDQDEMLDPRPCDIGSAYTTPFAAIPGNDPFFSAVDFKGAFSDEWANLWIRNWTALDRNNHLVNTPLENCSAVNTEDAFTNLFRIFPNPAKNQFTVESNLEESVTIDIFDLSGRRVADQIKVASGRQQVSINMLPTGLYIVNFRSEDGKVTTKKLIVE